MRRWARNSDLRIRELQRLTAAGDPEARLALWRAWQRIGDPRAHEVYEAIAADRYAALPSIENYIVWATARSQAGFGYEGVGLDNFIWGWVGSGFADEEVGDASYPGGVHASRVSLDGAEVDLAREVGGLERLPVDAWRFAVDHVGAIATVDHYGHRQVEYYRTPEEFELAWGEAVAAYDEGDPDEYPDDMPEFEPSLE